MPILQWILLLPATYLARWVALFAGVALHKAALHLCPRKYSSRACARQGGFRYLEGLITMHGARLTAVLILSVSVWLVASHKKVVTRVVFIGGCAVALYLAWLTVAWGSYLAAVTAEGVTFVFPLRTLNGPPAKLPDLPGVANVAFRRRASIRTRM